MRTCGEEKSAGGRGERKKQLLTCLNTIPQFSPDKAKRIPISAVETVTARNVNTGAGHYASAIADGYHDTDKIYGSASTAAFNWVQLTLSEPHDVVAIAVFM